MKKIKQLITYVLLFVLCFGCFGCVNNNEKTNSNNESQNNQQYNQNNNQNNGDNGNQTIIDPNQNHDDGFDYAGYLKLDMSSTTMKTEVTVRNFIDGDTTHFNTTLSQFEDGVIKARFLGVDTPESTGAIEEWGKKAAKFTKDKLSNAHKILIESDNDIWNSDSTGSRYLVWVWYKPDANSDYRCLNIELLQNGLSNPYNSGSNRYGNVALSALNYAQENNLYIFSNDKDPDFYYGEAQIVSLKELRLDPTKYLNTKVAVFGVVTRIADNTAYIQEFDEETGVYFGVAVYYGFSAPAQVLSCLKIGNLVRVVGSFQYYETGGTYQITDLRYDLFDNADNTYLIEKNNEVNYVLVDGNTFDSNIEIQNDDETTTTYKYGFLTLNTTISMNNLKVKSIYTTSTGSSEGALTLTCETSDGKRITVRTNVLKNENNQIVTADYYNNKTIDIKGIVSYYNESYQIKVFSYKDIIIK